MTTIEAAPPQHLQALARANHVRLARAAYKRSVLAGDVTVPDLLGDTPPELLSMPIGELLRAQRRWGRTKAQRFCSRMMVGENRRLGALTERQKGVLVKELSR